MKKFILSVFTLASFAFANELEFRTIQGDFIQVVKSNDKAINYSGKFYAKNDNNALWIYNNPSKKKIFFEKSRVVVVQDDLEQVIISEVKNMPNLANILKQAKKIKDGLYKTEFDEVEYFITLNGKFPSRIDYEDKLGNKIKITFSNVVKDYEITSEMLTPVIPSYYDIITQ